MTQFIDSFSEEVWNQNYNYHSDGNIDGTFRRVAKGIASVESTPELQKKWEEHFYDLLSDFKAVPGGRIISNAGTDYKGTSLLNCFVSPRSGKDIDSLNWIIDDLKNQTFTLKSEGGWGQNFSWIRPRGAFIKSIGIESPGAVKYMELYNKSSEIITSGSGKKQTNIKGKKKSRKGAQLGCLSCYHPDIIEFITAKQQPGRLSKFNISVDCSDEFMEKVVSDGDDSWDLIFPDTTFEKYKDEWDGDFKTWKGKGYPVNVYQTVSAKWLWNLIMESTYHRAEPGVMFLDRANYWAPFGYGEKISTTNPCVSGDTFIHTKEYGDIEIVKVLDEYVTIWNGFEWSRVIPKVTGKNQEVLYITFSNGKSLECTKYHSFFLENGDKIEAQKLNVGDTLLKFYQDDETVEEGISVVSINNVGYVDTVYCFNEPLRHCGMFNGIVTGQCGEIPLSYGSVCDLGSLNLTQYITGDETFDFQKLQKYVRILVRFLDNVNEYSNAPLPEYLDSMRNKRRLGIGIMGWGSLLIMMGIKFGSETANGLREKISQCISRTAYETSIDLAIEKGMFSYCDPQRHADGIFIKNLGLSEEYMKKLRETGIRNCALLTAAPTGNTGILANNVSGGLEPVFSYEYIRSVIVSEPPDEILELTPKWYEGEWKETDLFKFDKEGDEEILKGTFNGTVYKIDKNRGLVKEVSCKDYSVRYLEGKGKWNPDADYAISALELTVDEHLNDLIGFMRYIDNSASKTINIPFDYSFDDFKNVYLDAYRSGVVKGVTTYRAGTMASVLSVKESDSNYEEEIILDTVKMAESSEATMKLLRAEGRKWYMTIVWNETKTRPFAIFVQTNHPEKTVTTNDAVELLFDLAESKNIPQKFVKDVKEKISGDNNSRKITRALSLLLRHGVSIKNIVNTLSKVENVVVGSFLFQITKYLSGFIKDGDKVEDEKCSTCGMTSLVYREGCKVCSNCGASKCG